MKEWTTERVQQCFKELGFEFPSNEEEEKAFNEKFKDYPYKFSGSTIDPYKLLNDMKKEELIEKIEKLKFEKTVFAKGLIHNAAIDQAIVTIKKFTMYDENQQLNTSDNIEPLQSTDWNALRAKYFLECVTLVIEGECVRSEVNMAPHDLFEWFKKNCV